jgi:hypothetical protein
MVTTIAAVTSTMQIVKYHVMYNTTVDQNTPEADHCCGRGKGAPKKVYNCSNKYYLKHIVQVLLDHGHNKHPNFVTKDRPMLCP